MIFPFIRGPRGLRPGGHPARSLLFPGLACTLLAAPVWAQENGFPQFKTHDVDPQCGVGRMVEIVDVDGDGKPDILALTDTSLFWYKNPGWEKHPIVEQLDGTNICMAAQDLDGDSLPEIALGANWDIEKTREGGSLHLLWRDKDPAQPWKSRKLAEEPTLHRVCWADLDGDGKKELIAAPLKGRGSEPPYFKKPSVRLLRFAPPAQPFKDPWKGEVIDDENLTIVHGIRSVDWEGDGKEDLLTASLAGITYFKFEEIQGFSWSQFVAGNPVPFPGCGAGEVGIGDAQSEEPLLGTVEPWHGHQAVVYTLKRDRTEQVQRHSMWERHVIDDQMVGGHALTWADFDGDGKDEILVGYREKAGLKQIPGLNVFDITFDRNSKPAFSSEKHVIDKGGMATEGAVAADLNGDGRVDIVAIGRNSANLRFYENLEKGR